MATVYLAYDTKHLRAVAIKVLEPELAMGVAADRFQREIEIAARLSHPRIVPLHDSGHRDGVFFYVMPYVEGESLGSRLKRERQLPLADALRITREVAEALEYAHDHSVLHRDIKPANILLTSGGAVVADFGIAAALTGIDGDRLTQTGQSVGTAGYMSPEQASGERTLDSRSDLYSLACVLYEMLAGEPPYTGRSTQAIIGKQLSLPVPPIAAVRDTIPNALDLVVQRALAKVPADRFRSVGDFAGAIESAAAGVEVEPVRAIGAPRRRLQWFALGLLIAVGSISWLLGTRSGASPSSSPRVDNMRYAVFPFAYRDGVAPGLNETDRIHDALAYWDDLSVVGSLEFGDALVQREGDELTLEEASRLAVAHGAGRFIWGEVSPIGDSTRVRAGLYDATRDGEQLADHAIRLDSAQNSADSAYAELTNYLLFRGTPPPIGGTRSLAAQRSLEMGLRSTDAWDLSRADSFFAAATGYDPSFAQAHMWVALTRAWSGAEPAQWSMFAEQANLNEANLSDRDRAFTRAILAQGRGEFDRACPIWQGIVVAESLDFAAWYGLASCLAHDGAVLPSTSSPSGWSFRTSYHQALLAYQRAFNLRPSILASFHSDSYESLRRLFMIAGNDRRPGRAVAPDATYFEADPAWADDTLALVPYPAVAGQLRELTASQSDMAEAISELREVFRRVAVAWVASAPSDPAALNALAIAMGLQGDPAALDTLRRARVLVAEPVEQIRLTGTEVWMRVSFAFPTNLTELELARRIADSLLVATDVGYATDPVLASALAALLGQPSRSARYARAIPTQRGIGPPPLMQSAAAALLAFSALGGPTDSIVRLERDVLTAIDESISTSARQFAKLGYVGRSATLALPSYESPQITALAGSGDWLLDAQAALIAGDTAAVLAALEAMRETRVGLRPSDLTLDGLYPEAELIVALGDLERAAGWLDPTLRALPHVAPHVLATPERAGSLVRAAVLRARIAEQLGDEAEAQRWAAAVVTLWSDAEPFLQPIVSEMRRLADRT